METIKGIFNYLMTHGPAVAGILLTVVGVAEAVVRLTPTEKDDTAVERVGKWIRKGIDYASKFVPNKKKGGGEHVKQCDKDCDKEFSQKDIETKENEVKAQG